MVLDEQPQTTLHVRRARRGDDESLAWLFERFTPLLLAQARYRLGTHLAGVVSPEDVVQDVWAVALPALPGLEPGEGRETPVVMKFLSTTLLYRVNEVARRHIRQRTRSLQDDGPSGAGSALGRLPDASRGALSRIAEREGARRLLEEIERLSEADRQVMVLRGIEQHSNQETAELLGQTPNAVSLRYNRVLRTLRERLGRTGVLEEL